MAPRKRSQTVSLREERAVGFAPLAAGRARVDRENGVVFGVKVVGRTSSNTHGQRGANGTDYTLAALEEALPLYEKIGCNTGHGDPKNPNADRSPEVRTAWIEETRVTSAGIFGDLHFLDPADPLAVKVMNAAEKNPTLYALSHNALGRGDVVNGRYVISQIPEVRSVDIVLNGGTNQSLFEGLRRMTTLRKLLEAAKKTEFPKLRKLLEMDAAVGDAEVADDAEPDEMDHLFQAFKKCMADDPEKANKILAMLKADDGKEEEVKEDDDEDKEKPVDKDKKDKVEESRKLKNENRALRLLNESGLKATPISIKALCLLESEADQKAYVGELKGARGASAPRSSSGGYTPVRESATPKTAEEQALTLLR